MPARLPVTPARWLTLVLGVPVLLAIIGFTSFSTVAQIGEASFLVHAAIPVTGGTLTARIDGNITLRQNPAGSARVDGTAHYSLFRGIVTISADTVQYRCPLPIDNCELNATLQMPAKTALSLSTGGGDVDVPSFTGPFTLRTDGGNLTAGTLNGTVSLYTGGGDLDVSTLRGGPLNARLDGGNLIVQAMAVPDATIASSGGDVTMTYTAPPRNLTITSDGGNVILVVPRGQYKVYTNADGGNVSNAVGDDPDATDSISVDSSGGDITITEAS